MCSHLEATEDKREGEPDGSDGAEAMKAAKTNSEGREDEQMGIGKEVKTRRLGRDHDRWRKKEEDSRRPGSEEKTGRIFKGAQRRPEGGLEGDNTAIELGLPLGTEVSRRERPRTKGTPVNSGNGYRGTRHTLGNGRISEEVELVSM